MIDDPSNPNGIVIKEGSSWLCFYPSRPSRAWGALSPSARKQMLSKDSLQRIRPHSYGLACLALEARVTCAAFYWLTGHQPMTPNSFNRLSIKKTQTKKKPDMLRRHHTSPRTYMSLIHSWIKYLFMFSAPAYGWLRKVSGLQIAHSVPGLPGSICACLEEGVFPIGYTVFPESWPHGDSFSSFS